MFKKKIYKKNQKECIKSYNWFQTFCTTKHSLFYENTHSLDESDEKQNLEGTGYKAKDSLKKLFDKKLCSMGSKCLVLNASHMSRK